MGLFLALLGSGLLIVQVKVWWFRCQAYRYLYCRHQSLTIRAWIREMWWVDVIDVGLTGVAFWLVVTRSVS